MAPNRTVSPEPGQADWPRHRPGGRQRLRRFLDRLPACMRRPWPWPSCGLGQRGATSAMVAASGTVLIGMAGLATEAGSWYLARRNAATAADLAALAAAAARDRGEDAVPVALDTVARNGFPPGGTNSVTAFSPPVSGAFAGNAWAVEVVVAQTQTIGLARLFLSTPPVVRARAVAAARVDEEVCMLSLNQLTLGGNSTTQAGRCVLASNAASPGGISVVGSALVRTAGLITTGTCTGCDSGDVWTDDTRRVRPMVAARRPDPIVDPFAGLRDWIPSPPACRTTPINLDGGKGSTGNPSISPDEGAICDDLSIGPKQSLTLAPGLYYFRNADLDVKGNITGDGVTLVFTGDNDRVGTIHINAQSTGSLRGPTRSLIDGHPEAAGLVLYRDWNATNNGSANEVHLNGGSTMRLTGGVYLPTSDVVVNGKSDIGSDCLSIVGYNLSYSGTADTQVDVSGCAGYAPYPVLRTVRLVE